MDNNVIEQREALETLIEFNQRLLKNMTIIIKELSGERLDDTDKFLNGIVNAMNWEIGVMNGTMSLLNDGEERIDKAEFNDKIQKFGNAIQAKEDSEIADAIQMLIPEFVKLGEASQKAMERSGER